jgi:hypothetical protein
MTRAAVAALVVASTFAASCMLYRGSPGKDPWVAQNDPVGAAVFAGSAVAAARVNRALTNECYSTCPYGTACNHATGMCEAIGCACRADLTCERIGGENVCVSRPARDMSSDGGGGGGDGGGGDGGERGHDAGSD